MGPKSASKSKAREAIGTLERRSNKATSASAPQPIQWRSLMRNGELWTAVWLIMLAAFWSPVSQISLSPVYGGVPTNLFHRHGTMASALVAFATRYKFGDVVRDQYSIDVQRYIPTFAFWIPSIQYILFQQSWYFGNPYGPLITESLTYFPLVLLSGYSAAGFLSKVDFSAFGETLAEGGPALASYIIFTIFEKLARGFIAVNIGANLFMSRIGLQISTAILYSLVLPSATLWPAVPSLVFTLGFNIHNPMQATTARLNATLSEQGFALVERKESNTGYISVLDNLKDGFRVMRCDHSLLGGQWSLHKKGPAPSVAEPVYAIFAMLEAVRLVVPDHGGLRRPDLETSALNIGLGIGTTPGAFIMHGISTSIVEIDPVVYEFAQKHFELPSNHSPAIVDARRYVTDAQAFGNTTFDYIVHDVFTGGAEPVDLFTTEFLFGLRSLLKQDGVIAINYAGDLSTSSARMIIHTIRAVFPSCRIFRENEPPPRSETVGAAKAGGADDFTNMVIFCKTTTKTPLTFRKPVESDFLHSRARRAHLYPRHEILEEEFAVKGGPQEMEKLILKKGNTKPLENLQVESAVGHWWLMRTVLPREVWENW